MTAGDEIGRAMNQIRDEQVREAASARRAQAMAVIATIASGTRDSELTREQKTALDNYERANALLAALHENGEWSS